MAFPGWADLGSFVIILAIGISLAYLFSRALKLHPKLIEIKGKQKEVVLSLLVFLAAFAITFGIYAFYQNVWVRLTLTEDLIYVLRETIWIIAIILPVIIVMKLTGKNIGSIGITRENIKKNFALGLLLSAAFIAIFAFLSTSIGGVGFVGFSIPAVYSLISYAIIGFGEEIVFRGYIQTRLTAAKGVVFGLLVSSVLYAVFQFPVGYFCYNGDVYLSLFYALWRLSAGLLFGYIYYRSQNIVPSSILHALLIWGTQLWGLYF